MQHRPFAAAVFSALLLGACTPSLTSRPVAIPPDCERVLQELVERGQEGFDERTASYATFCQQQRLLRAEEEQATLARLKLEERSQLGRLAPLAFALGLLVVIAGN